MNNLVEKTMCLSPIKRWLVLFFVIGMYATLAFIPVAMLFGFSLPAVICPAVGCGIGAGLVNATLLSLI
jgi:hypothetical protein